MKVNFIVLTFCLLSTYSFGQSSDETSSKKFDYIQTKHELGVDVRPLFNGSSPSSLFYRKNYTGQGGKNMGFRLGGTFMNSFNDSQISFQGSDYENSRIINYGLTIGLERQKFISDMFIAYGGFDLSGALSQIRYARQTGTVSGNNPRHASVNASAIGLGNFWGMKYHFNSRLSFSAETGFDVIYSSSNIRLSDNVGTISTDEGPKLWSFNLVPLKALRLSYHF
ncbi:hypothetical protein ACFOUP_02610 [Belliella kenyensis]|uniref:Outer membrane protein beta-barrel domain-containing protein n=1 Tax=Belliella kenyensis TaxID=1472724 RepID=A0ABV8EHK4_9BACT|nr:hypothetical protein [Belliella kenyensis]MCH7400909.1 hypothetical protein [Belliella kenyensis]MDN3603908.1 hypothetical protein [Belliella kenyensis]